MKQQCSRGFIKRSIATLLVLVMLIGMLPNVSYAATTFTPRLTAPSSSNLYYKSHKAGGKNYCVDGHHIYGYGYPSVLPNCVGYAWGRAYEITGAFPNLSRAHAKKFWGHTSDGYRRSKNVPKLGAIACFWTSGYGHVAVVEEINGNKITLSQSSWNYYPSLNRKRNFDYPTVFFVETINKPTQGQWVKGYGKFQGYIYIGDFVSVNQVKPPSVASVNLGPDNRALGQSVTASWSSSNGATSYDVKLICTTNSSYNQTKNGVKGTNKAFIVNHPGTYKVSVVAKNSAGASGARQSGTITVHANKTVNFVDWDGNLIKNQTVKYGGNATAPMAPSREGYTFQGWNKGYSNVKSDLTVRATYSVNKYNVKFVGKDGQVISAQSIAHGSAATAPVPPNEPNYTFIKWDSDAYLDVTKPLTITASYRWTNPDLPNVAQITSATRLSDGSGYNVFVKLQNSPNQNVKGRVIVALKNEHGKMVQSETATYYLNELNATSKQIFVPYSGVATLAEVAVVGLLENGNTGVPLAEKATAPIDLGLAWSDWSTEQPPSGDNVISESRTEYRYRDKLTTTRTTTYPTTSTSLPGWSHVNSYISSWNNWSGWSKNRQSTAAGKEEQTRWVNPTYKTVYKYYRYKYWNTTYHKWYYTYAWGAPTGATRHDITLDYSLTKKKAYDGHWAYGTYNYNNTGGNNLWWANGTAQVQTHPGYTQYRYRTANYTHQFEKWDDWSAWSPNSTSSSSTRQVQTRTVYRYKSNVTADLQDDSGVQRTISGTLDVHDKLATLLVFRKTNIDPTASQLEYVAQSQLSSTGEYNFTFKTKEEPSVETGDFIAMLAVEGGTAPVYIDKFEAPLPTYTVQFVDEEGMVVSQQTVVEGDSAELPQAPTKEGYDFIGWDANVTNVGSDITAQAQYQPKTYNVVFVDWNAEFVEVAQYNHGDIIADDNMPTREGYTFANWQDEEEEIATEVVSDMILTAKYDKNHYTVKFMDWDDNVISEQIIPYGESATIPELDDPDNGMKFGGFADYEQACVVEANRTFRPVAIFAETVETPVANITSDYYDSTQSVALSTETEGAKIYYTLDGTEPFYEEVQGGVLQNPNQYRYNGPITVDEDTQLIAMAFKHGMNDSAWLFEEYLFDGEGNGDTELSISLSASGNGIKVSWDSVDGVDGYQVMRADKVGGPYTEFKKTTGQVYTNMGKLVAGMPYFYKVRSYTIENGEYVYGDFSEVKGYYAPGDLATPEEPDLTLDENAGGVRLNWDEQDRIIGYQVYRSTSTDKEFTYLKTASGAATKYTNLAGLTSGRPYYYKIRAYRMAKGVRAYGEFSDIKGLFAGTDEEALRAPNFSLEDNPNVSAPNVRVRWSKVNGADGYCIYRWDGVHKRWIGLKKTGPNARVYTNINGVVDGKTNFYAMRPYHISGNKTYYGNIGKPKGFKVQ